jgi:hypothetical protein
MKSNCAPLSAFGISPQKGERFSWERVVVFVILQVYLFASFAGILIFVVIPA